MTLRLLLMRHGKSDWSADFGHDRDRPLAERGIRAVQSMAEFLARGDQLPRLVISSNAIRAQQTAELFIRYSGANIPLKQSEHFYESIPQRVLSQIQLIDSDREVMLVGHQPTWSVLASQLIGGGSLAFPTAAIARIDFECDRWSQVNWGTGVLKWLLQPKLLSA